ncbi:TPA: tripartite tricarboxylate transporter TctB family protein [Staphylococcus delphini]|nr:tripartite tricarboxylate transporter TctB family protein [Staphylococcus delphini]HEC2226747.1 tripartite tricarboxylate transporter TctB family protein [Staphylococcus delphini]
MVRLIAPIVCFIVGVTYLLLSLNLPISRIGDPQSPKYFPILIASLLIVMSIIYFFQMLRDKNVSFNEFKAFLTPLALKRIGLTCLFILIYTVIFERIGFLISTVLFLAAVMFLVNGFQHWLKNLIVAIVFSGVAWYTFAQLLDVSLP